MWTTRVHRHCVLECQDGVALLLLPSLGRCRAQFVCGAASSEAVVEAWQPLRVARRREERRLPMPTPQRVP
eukprot:93892-Lingulodinium_polyedra.AAC.1